MLTLTRRYLFSAAHRLAVAGWDDERNRRVFGVCGRPESHGHNYALLVTLLGVPDPETGAILPAGLLDRLVEERVLSVLDHRDATQVLAAAGLAPATAENLARWAGEALRGPLAGLPARLLEVAVEETPKNSVGISFETRGEPWT